MATTNSWEGLRESEKYILVAVASASVGFLLCFYIMMLSWTVLKRTRKLSHPKTAHDVEYQYRANNGAAARTREIPPTYTTTPRPQPNQAEPDQQTDSQDERLNAQRIHLGTIREESSTPVTYYRAPYAESEGSRSPSSSRRYSSDDLGGQRLRNSVSSDANEPEEKRRHSRRSFHEIDLAAMGVPSQTDPLAKTSMQEAGSSKVLHEDDSEFEDISLYDAEPATATAVPLKPQVEDQPRIVQAVEVSPIIAPQPIRIARTSSFIEHLDE
ncbi:hypothetical protein F4808DRAFT_404845 [Astrocystis sublimbata]|nr:hypothetical protein F4808DRAFT_404845 [Astrocystis sublimbata]